MFEEIDRLRSTGTPQEMKFAAALFETTPQTGKQALLSLFEEAVISYREADRAGSAIMIMTAIMAYVLEHAFIDLRFAADIAKVAIDHPIISCNRWLLDMTTMFNAAVVGALHTVTPELLPSSGSSSMCYSTLAEAPSAAEEVAVNTLHNALCDFVSLVRRTRPRPGTWSELLEETVLALVCSELRSRMLMHSNHLYVLYRPLSIRPIHLDVVDAVYRSCASRSGEEHRKVLEDMMCFEKILRESIAADAVDTQQEPPAGESSVDTQQDPPAGESSVDTQQDPLTCEPSINTQQDPPAGEPSTNTQQDPPADEPSTGDSAPKPSAGSAFHVVVEVTDEVRAFAPYPGMPDLPPRREVSDGMHVSHFLVWQQIILPI